jgi:hypothetical protein
MNKEALRYLALGFSVIPLGQIKRKESGKGKDITYPIAWSKYQKERADEKTVKSWNWTNLGVITGEISNLVVIDTDDYKSTFDTELFKSFNIPITPCQKTAGGGKQYFFKHPSGLLISDAVNIVHEGSGIDVRGDGGMVIVPPTKTTYGEYSWIIDPFETPLAELPPKILEILKDNYSSESNKHKKLTEIVNLIEGEGRDSAMTSFVGTLAMSINPNRWLEEIPKTMTAVNNTYKPPLSKEDLIKIYNSITKKELKRRESKVEQKKYVSSITFNDLMTQEYPAARFILNPYFETNAVNMVSAPPNTWKSWLVFLLAGSIAHGDRLWEQFETEQSSVMIVNEEDSPRSVQDRFKLLNITNKALPIFFHIAQGLKIDKIFVDNIIKEMKEKGCKVLMLDSLRSMHDAEENDSTEMQGILDYLKEIARNEITVIFTHHHRKRHPLDKSQSADASRGSSAINAAISGHISLDEEKRENGTFLIVHHLKSKVAAKIDPVEVKISRTDLTGVMSFEYQGKFRSSSKKIEISKEAIIKNLKEGSWMTVNDFIELEIASDSIIRTALRELKKAGVAMTMTRADAKVKNIEVNGEGRANELIYAWCEGKENELDTLASDLQTIDPNEVPI